MPEANLNPNQSLPTPAMESLPPSPQGAGETVDPKTVETPPIESGPATKEVVKPATESGSQNIGQPGLPVSLPSPIAPAAPAAAQAPAAAGVDDSSPAIADDVDVIEKEWVDKAKAIVDKHRDDPYQQEEEANKLQSSYLKKRYGKTIKKSA
ncbi:MAG: hypothetical protein R3313_02740 [Candidatus Saccharimonadales bacterium]|nr:hypothetical protein [Candidatus Saccharimonadales bacterium]